MVRMHNPNNVVFPVCCSAARMRLMHSRPDRDPPSVARRPDAIFTRCGLDGMLSVCRASSGGLMSMVMTSY